MLSPVGKENIIFSPISRLDSKNIILSFTGSRNIIYILIGNKNIIHTLKSNKNIILTPNNNISEYHLIKSYVKIFRCRTELYNNNNKGIISRNT